MTDNVVEADGMRWTIDQFIDAYAYIRVPPEHNWVSKTGYNLLAFPVPVIVLRKSGSLYHGFLDQLDMTDVVAWRPRDFIGEPAICDACNDFCSEDQIVDFDNGVSWCSYCESEGDA